MPAGTPQPLAMSCCLSVGCCPVPRLASAYLPLQHASNISAYPSLHRPVSKPAPRQVGGCRNLYSPGEQERTQDPDLPQAPKHSPAHENSLAMAQAVTNVLSLLPGWWRVRVHPVPRLQGGGPGAVFTHSPTHPITLSTLPRQSPHFDLGGVWPGKWPPHPALTPSGDKMLAGDQRKFKTPKSH